MPIASTVYEILYGGCPASEGIERLSKQFK